MNCALQLIPAVLDRIAVRRTNKPRQNVDVLLFYKYASILAHPVVEAKPHTDISMVTRQTFSSERGRLSAAVA